MERPGGAVSSISGETLAKARRELREDPEQRPEAIEELRRRILAYEADPQSEPFPFGRSDDRFLLRFLRARKFDTDRALQLFLNYWRFRHKHSELLGDLHPRAVQHVLHSGVVAVLQPRMKDGSKAICIFPARYDITQTPLVDVLKTLLLVLEKLIDDEETQVHGVTFLDNMEGLGLYHVLRVASSEHLQRATVVELVQDAFPARFKGAHLLKQPWYIGIVFRIIRPFLNQKLQSRIHMHGSDMAALHDLLDPQQLPADLGGPQPPTDPSSLLELFQEDLLD